jgi:hypothetical protein
LLLVRVEVFRFGAFVRIIEVVRIFIIIVVVEDLFVRGL